MSSSVLTKWYSRVILTCLTAITVLFFGEKDFKDYLNTFPKADAQEVNSFSKAPRGNSETARKKRALVIAISTYSQEFGEDSFSELNAEKDATLIVDALRHHEFSDISVIKDAEATQAGIRREIDRLIERSGKGDIVAIHYSGHGVQLRDDNGDEFDGLDESIVPHDAPAYYGAKGNEYLKGNDVKFIRDDELNRKLIALREKLGKDGHVVVFFDSCHSGTGTRNNSGAQPRGSAEPIGDPSLIDVTRGSENAAGFDFLTVPEEGNDLASFVSISGATSGEWNYETMDSDGDPVGSLSLALSTKLKTLNTSDTYDALFTRMAVEMTHLTNWQTPTIEGNSNTRVFDGDAVTQAFFHEVEQFIEEEQIAVMKEGRLSGLLEGTEIVFYPIGTENPQTTSSPPLASGYVQEATNFYADVKLDSTGTDVDLIEAWGFVSQYGFGNLSIEVIDSEVIDIPGFQSLTDTLSKLHVINPPDLKKRSEVVSLTLIPASDKVGEVEVYLKTSVDGRKIGQPKTLTSKKDLDQLVNNMLNYARNQYLKKVDLKSGFIDVELELVPATHRIRGNTCRSSSLEEYNAVRKSGYWQLTPGDGFLLKVNNNSFIDVYVAILSLMPNGTISQLVPYFPRTDREYVVAAKDSVLISSLCFAASDNVYGTEVLKLFASEQPINFDAILGEVRSNAMSNKARNPLEQLVLNAHSGLRANVQAREKFLAATSDVVLRVCPKGGNELVPGC